MILTADLSTEEGLERGPSAVPAGFQELLPEAPLDAVDDDEDEDEDDDGFAWEEDDDFDDDDDVEDEDLEYDDDDEDFEDEEFTIED